MTTKSSGFSLIELLVVIAIIGVLSSVGVVTYSSYVQGTKKTSAESAMQQISLAQTEEYSNSGEYFTQVNSDSCTPTSTTSDDIMTTLFGGANIIDDSIGFEMCIADDGASFIVVASQGAGQCTITMTANGIWTRELC